MLEQETQEETANDLDATEEAEADLAEVAEVEEETEAEDDQPQDDDDNSGEEQAEAAALTITIDGEEESEDEPASQGIRDLRKAHRDQKKRIKDLEAQLQAQKTPQQALGEKPKLEDFDYDADRFETALLDWNARKAEADKKAEDARMAQESLKERYTKRLTDYNSRKEAIGVADFEDAEDAVIEALSTDKQQLLLMHAENPEHIVYALGKRGKKLKEFADMEPTQFLFELGRLESAMKVTKTSKPKPEKRVSAGGGGGVPGSLKKQLEKARESGDINAAVRIRRQMAQAK